MTRHRIKSDYMTTGQAAALLCCSQQTVIRLFDEGRLTGFRLPTRGGGAFRRVAAASVFALREEMGLPPATEADATAAGI
jgi:excisionase family DNA binding protein